MFVALLPDWTRWPKRHASAQPAVGDPVRGHLQRDRHHRAGILLSLRGVRYTPEQCVKLLSRNLYVYGLGGIVARSSWDPHRPRHPVRTGNVA